MNELSAELTLKVEEVLASDMGALTKWNRIEELLLFLKVAYHVEAVKCDEFLVHPHNRGRLGLNPFDVHRIGSNIKRAGADMSLLTKAVAFEVSPLAAVSKEQFDFNRNLVAMSKGLLAPVNGSERFMTVGCGHTAAFIKCVLAGCMSPDGTKLTLEYAGHDMVLRNMINKGWGWTIIPHYVEKRFPNLPFVAQQALNAMNNAANQVSELEAACSLHEFVNLGNTWDVAVKAVAGANPPCSEYLDIISQYTQLHSGGEGGPMLKYLDKFAKAYGGSKKLGGEFFQALVDLRVKGTQAFPHLRTALLATNLAMPKNVDGFARFVTKSDVDRLKSPKQLTTIKDFEEMHNRAWLQVQQLITEQRIANHTGIMIFGKMSIRMTLLLLNKKNPHDETEMYNFQHVFDLMDSDLSSAQTPCAGSSSSGSSSKSIVNQVRVPVPTFQDMAGPAWMLQKQLGYTVGLHYCLKGEAGIYQLTHIDDKQMTFEEHRVDSAKVTVVRIQLEQVLGQASRFKGNIPLGMPESIIDIMAHSSKPLDLECQQASMFCVLVGAACQLSQENDMQLFYSMKPYQVTTKSAWKKRQLKLLPATDSSCKLALDAPAPNAPQIKNKDYEFHIGCPNMPKGNIAADWSNKLLVSAYWWVATTTSESDANMEKLWHKSGQHEIQIMSNSRPLKKGEILLIFEGRAAEEGKQKRQKK